MKIITKTFTGQENHAVTSVEAIDFIRNHRTHYAGTASGCYADAQTVKALVEQPGAVGMRYYYTLDRNDRKGIVLVGTDANRQDLLRGAAVKRAMFNPPFTLQGTYDKAQLNHSIALEDAASLTANYRAKYTGKVKGGFFGKEALQALLEQPDCVGIHFLYGAKKDAIPVMVMVGVDKFGATMFFEQLMEASAPCPPFCGYDNILNAGQINVSNVSSDIDYEAKYLKAA